MNLSHPPQLILASSSPRRRELLTQIGVQHQVVPADIDEALLGAEHPEDYVLRLARQKAEYVWHKLAGATRLPVLGADTAVVQDGIVFGKPASRAAALAMMGKLSGRAHQVLSAVALVSEHGTDARLSISTVRFRPLAPSECVAYWDSGEPHDKAGAYAIQGRAAEFIEYLSGSYSGVMGLPLFETAALLRAAGVDLKTGATA